MRVRVKVRLRVRVCLCHLSWLACKGGCLPVMKEPLASLPVVKEPLIAYIYTYVSMQRNFHTVVLCLCGYFHAKRIRQEEEKEKIFSKVRIRLRGRRAG